MFHHMSERSKLTSVSLITHGVTTAGMRATRVPSDNETPVG